MAPKNSYFKKNGVFAMSDFDAQYKYAGFAPEQFRKLSNSYAQLVGSHVSENGNHVVVDVSSDNVYPTKFGYAMIVDRTHVVYVKNWQVWGCPRVWGGVSDKIVISFNRDFLKIQESKREHEGFSDVPSLMSFDDLVALAKEREEYHAANDLPFSF